MPDHLADRAQAKVRHALSEAIEQASNRIVAQAFDALEREAELLKAKGMIAGHTKGEIRFEILSDLATTFAGSGFGSLWGDKEGQQRTAYSWLGGILAGLGRIVTTRTGRPHEFPMDVNVGKGSDGASG